MKNRIITAFLFVSLILTHFYLLHSFVNDKYLELRQKMVKEQIIARGIKNKNVLSAMLKVERHRFVPKNLWNYAYEDYPLPIAEEQTISQPYIVALMTELLKVNKKDRILEIGIGSGYQAAILSELCKDVYTIEVIPELGNSAEILLKQLGYNNVKVKIGDGFLGWDEYAPYDKIILTCAPKEIPEPLINQLKEGGILVAPIGEYFQDLIVAKKKKGKITKKSIIPVRFVPMIEKREH